MLQERKGRTEAQAKGHLPVVEKARAKRGKGKKRHFVQDVAKHLPSKGAKGAFARWKEEREETTSAPESLQLSTVPNQK